jgi:hypothetical protein
VATLEREVKMAWRMKGQEVGRLLPGDY